jgi:hypothetical protein
MKKRVIGAATLISLCLSIVSFFVPSPIPGVPDFGLRVVLVLITVFLGGFFAWRLFRSSKDSLRDQALITACRKATHPMGQAQRDMVRELIDVEGSLPSHEKSLRMLLETLEVFLGQLRGMEYTAPDEWKGELGDFAKLPAEIEYALEALSLRNRLTPKQRLELAAGRLVTPLERLAHILNNHGLTPDCFWVTPSRKRIGK